MKYLSADECKNKMFTILIDFVVFCQENNLKYYLGYGTLLGGVRHQDFIPWDDDIDVLMPRADYEKFKKLFEEKYKGSKYQLRSKMNSKVNLPFEKIMDVTTIVKSKMNDVDDHLWIDIFPLDGLSSKRENALSILNKARKTRKYYGYASAKIGSGTTRMKAFFKIPVLIPFHIIGENYFTNKLKKLSNLYSYEESDYIGNIAWSSGKEDMFLKSDFDDFVEVDFHGAKLHAMKNPDKYLRQIYGDYMKLPPLNDRINHCFEAYDLNGGE